MNPDDEALIRDYLLGDMPSQQREVFDERMISDTDFVEQTEALEGELIRDALRGALPPVDQSRFERYFLSFPHLRQKYELTREMLIAGGVDAASLRTAPPKVPVAAKRSAHLFDLWKLSLVAAVSVALVLTWQNLMLRSQVRQLAIAARRPGSTPVASLLLQPGLERRGPPGGPGQAPMAIQIPDDAGVVRVHLEFEGAERHGAYTVVVNAVDRREQAWGQEGLSAVTVGAIQSVTAEIPATSLPPGDYTVLLQTPETPKDPVIETYSFRVARPRAR